MCLASSSKTCRSPCNSLNNNFRCKENLEGVWLILHLLSNCRLQREEEEAFASSQSSQGAQSLTFSKFEEKKTNEKTRKVTTVKKFFSASSRVGSKKGNFRILFFLCAHMRYRVDPQCMWTLLFNFCKHSGDINPDLKLKWGLRGRQYIKPKICFGWRTLCVEEACFVLYRSNKIKICRFVYKMYYHPNVCLFGCFIFCAFNF